MLYPVRGVHFQGARFFKNASDICDTRTDDAHVFCASAVINYIYPCAQQREIYLMYAIIRTANSLLITRYNYRI